MGKMGSEPRSGTWKSVSVSEIFNLQDLKFLQNDTNRLWEAPRSNLSEFRCSRWAGVCFTFHLFQTPGKLRRWRSQENMAPTLWKPGKKRIESDQESTNESRANGRSLPFFLSLATVEINFQNEHENTQLNTGNPFQYPAQASPSVCLLYIFIC